MLKKLALSLIVFLFTISASHAFSFDIFAWRDRKDARITREYYQKQAAVKVLNKLITTYQKQDFQEFASFISPNYIEKQAFIEQVKNSLIDFDYVEIKCAINRIKVTKTHVFVDITYIKTLSNSKDELNHIKGDCELVLEDSQDRLWLVRQGKKKMF